MACPLHLEYELFLPHLPLLTQRSGTALRAANIFSCACKELVHEQQDYCCCCFTNARTQVAGAALYMHRVAQSYFFWKLLMHQPSP